MAVSHLFRGIGSWYVDPNPGTTHFSSGPAMQCPAAVVQNSTRKIWSYWGTETGAFTAVPWQVQYSVGLCAVPDVASWSEAVKSYLVVQSRPL